MTNEKADTIEQNLEGATVVGIFKHSDEYRKEMGWEDDRNDGITILFSNGARIHSQQDVEGSGPGHMILEEPSGEECHIFPKTQIENSTNNKEVS